MTTWLRSAIIALLAGLMAGCAMTQPKAHAFAGDDGYFLTFQQKGQLVG